MKPMLGSFDGSMMETELKMDNKTIKKLPSNYYENLGKILENVTNKKFKSSGVKVATSSTEKDMLQEYEANVRRMKSLKRFGVNLSSTVQSSDENAESTKKDDEENVEEEEEEGTRNTLTSFEKQMFSHSAAASKNAERKRWRVWTMRIMRNVWLRHWRRKERRRNRKMTMTLYLEHFHVKRAFQNLARRK